MKLYIKTPARLHFGLIDLNGELGRFFGGIGLAINRPNVILEAKTSEDFFVTGKKGELVRILARKFFEKYRIKAGVNIEVKQTIPEHSGLGSGTQLSLAVATALAKLFRVKASIQELSFTMGRIKRTGVGTVVFEQGGFIVDGGKKMKNGSIISESFPPLIFRHSFPENWMFVISIPK